MEGEGVHEVDPVMIRADYREAALAFVERWRRFCSEHGIDYLQATSDRSKAALLSEFAARRRGQRRLR
jgi:hypothetical protein